MYDQVIWSPGVTLEQIEEMVILKAYSHYHQNKVLTASALGISERTLHTKIKLYEDKQAAFKEAEAERKRRNEEFLKKARGIQPPPQVENPVLTDEPKATTSDYTTSLKPKGRTSK